MAAISRRTFLKGLVAGAVVVGFDPFRRSWVTDASAATANFPTFDGVLYTDSAALAAAADDFGHIVHRTPTAVLKAGSVNDIVKAVNFARANGIKVAGRGQAHSSYGQPQVESGIVIDMGGLDTIHAITSDYADVDAGAIWSTIAHATLAQGLTPPVFTDYIELSVGGTLSVGGIGGASHKHGVQIDNVLELTVVTGEGDVETCSPKHKAKLFNAVLAGLGQFGIIVRAKIRLIPAKTQARVYTAAYDDLAVFTADQQLLIADKRFDYVEGQAVPNGAGGWSFMIELATFYSPPATPNDAALLAGLRYNPGTVTTEDKTYFGFIDRLAPAMAFLKAIGVWGFPHPWLNLFVPASEVNNYVGDILSTLTLDDTGQGPVLLYPINTDLLTRPFFSVPEGETCFLFSILRTAPPVQPVVDAMVAGNRALYEQNRALGGTAYAISAIPLAPADWEQQFGTQWDDFGKAKKKYDPDNVLTPGQNIF
ncbi:MAG TPA: FAD-binding protein [Herpetosiphonaceae bacterium]|nr:FAD-binding protein [Herpetosiphonaceae bacterium]